MARPARAAESSVELALAPQACVTAAAVVVAAEGRGIAVRTVTDSLLRPRGALRYAVRVEPRGDTSDRAIEVTMAGEDDRGSFAVRTFQAASCEEATSAIALVLAVGPASDSRPEALHVDDALPDRPPVSPKPAPSPKAASTPLRGYVSLGPGARSLVEGQSVATLALGLRKERPVLPWVEAGLVVGLPRTIEGGGGQGTFTSYAGRLVVAPLAFVLASRIQLSVAVGLEVGVLTGAGAGPQKVESPTRPTVAAIAGGRAHVALSQLFFAQIDAFGMGSVLRDDFAFVNGGSTYRAPVLAFSLGANVGVTFP